MAHASPHRFYVIVAFSKFERRLWCPVGPQGGHHGVRLLKQNVSLWLCLAVRPPLQMVVVAFTFQVEFQKNVLHLAQSFLGSVCQAPSQSEPCRPQAHLAVPSVPGSIFVRPSLQMVVMAFTFQVEFQKNVLHLAQSFLGSVCQAPPESEPCRPQAHLAVPSVPGSISVRPSLQMVVVAFTFKVMFWGKMVFPRAQSLLGLSGSFHSGKHAALKPTLLCPRSPGTSPCDHLSRWWSWPSRLRSCSQKNVLHLAQSFLGSICQAPYRVGTMQTSSPPCCALSPGKHLCAAISPVGGRGLHVSGEWMTFVLATEHVEFQKNVLHLAQSFLGSVCQAPSPVGTVQTSSPPCCALSPGKHLCVAIYADGGRGLHVQGDVLGKMVFPRAQSLLGLQGPSKWKHAALKPTLLCPRSPGTSPRRLWCPVGPPRWPSRRPTLKTNVSPLVVSCVRPSLQMVVVAFTFQVEFQKNVLHLAQSFLGSVCQAPSRVGTVQTSSPPCCALSPGKHLCAAISADGGRGLHVQGDVLGENGVSTGPEPPGSVRLLPEWEARSSEFHIAVSSVPGHVSVRPSLQMVVVAFTFQVSEWMTFVLATEDMGMRLSRRLTLGHRGPFTIFSVTLCPWEWADPKPKTPLLYERNATQRSSSKKMAFIWPRASWALSVRLLPESDPCRPEAHLAVPSVPGSIFGQRSTPEPRRPPGEKGRHLKKEWKDRRPHRKPHSAGSSRIETSLAGSPGAPETAERARNTPGAVCDVPRRVRIPQNRHPRDVLTARPPPK
ncbi:hypothetical protein QTO34_012784 [Cnephaeus nilssonii]|uniref:Uncharacterized protein n=1 Tax=Cnephaeus nilssonii TaxID=3371016 RepID=A0AA40HBW4_CNENI|nr:hypothetical protein QTO34_012784 [Eptesicus nilssonii]